MSKKISIVGRRYARLIVVREVEPRFYGKHRKTCYECLCDCGKSVEIVAMSIISGASKSCGCLNDELKRNRITHGFARTGKLASIYRLWQEMKLRCSKPKNHNWKNYGGRGIYVCRRWQKFENFFADMGHKPPGKSLGRKDNNGPYSPDNCRWETAIQQGRNTRSNRIFTINGITGCITELAIHFGIKRVTVSGRLYRGWSPHEAFTGLPHAVNHPTIT